jgi:hypothetical protein
MDRKEKETRVLKQDGKVFEIHDLRIDERYRSEEYSLSKPDVPAITPTGRLVIFELRPVGASGPSFVGRWDGGSRSAGKQERDDLDIDIEGVSRRVVRQFERGEAGYSGHHTTKVPTPKGKAYRVCICIPQKMIFDGTVSFSGLRKMAVSVTTATTATVGIEAIFQTNRPRSLWSRIKELLLRIFRKRQ